MTTPEQNQAEADLRAFARRFIKDGTQDEYDALVSSYRVRRLKLRPEQVRAIVQAIIEERKSEKQVGAPLPSEERTASPASTSIPTRTTGQPTPFDQNESTELSPDQPSAKKSVTESTNRIIESTAQQSTTANPATPNSTAGSSEINQLASSGGQSTATAPTTASNSTSNSTSSISTAPTSMPPKDAEYFKHLKEYEDAYLEAMQADLESLQRGELPPTEASNARLRKLIEDYDLSKSDVADSMVRASQRFLDSRSSSNPSEPAPSGSSVESHASSVPSPDLVDPELLQQLENYLKQKNFRQADAVTFGILLKLIKPPSAWLDAASLEEFSKTVKSQGQQAIREIDRLWTHYSEGKFGFSRQLAIYEIVKEAVRNTSTRSSIDDRQNREYALAFSKEAGWWIGGLEFLKPYRHLQFNLEAPAGHLPAYWFWHISQNEAFRLGTLLGSLLFWLPPERGGCRMDAFTIPAFMEMVRRCGINPAPVSPLIVQSTRVVRTAGTTFPTKKGPKKR